MAMSLTARQAQCLALIRETIAETGRAPSLQDICDEMDLSSKSQVHVLLTALEERGAIRRIPNHARAIEILSDAPPADLRTLDDKALEALVVAAIGERLRRQWALEDTPGGDKPTRPPVAPTGVPISPPRPRTPEDGRPVQTPEDGLPVHTR
ncbi:MAG: LexA family protein [Brevundimonas sp.]